jgi:DNA transposition AAA+ family ATPase
VRRINRPLAPTKNTVGRVRCPINATGSSRNNTRFEVHEEDMRSVVAPISNIGKLAALGEALNDRSANLPGIAVAYGESGIGKSTGVTWLCSTKINACYVRAMQVWSPGSMLQAIVRELDIEAPHRLSQMIELIVSELSRTRRILIVDEADYIVDQVRLLNVLRDLHDLSTMPLILVGMGDFVRKLRTRADQRQFSGRVAFELEFAPLRLPDVKILADAMCEIEVVEDLLRRLHEESNGITRLVCVGLARIEAFARSSGLRSVSLKQWGARTFNLLSSGRQRAA